MSHPLLDNKYRRKKWLRAMSDLIRGRSMFFEVNLDSVEIIAGKKGHWTSGPEWSGTYAHSDDSLEGVTIRGFGTPPNNQDGSRNP